MSENPMPPPPPSLPMDDKGVDPGEFVDEEADIELEHAVYELLQTLAEGERGKGTAQQS